MVLKYDSATNTFRDTSENAVAASFYNQKATTQDIIKKTASHRGGGGGGGSSTQGFSTMYPTETSPLIPSPQAQSQAAQDLSRTLARQNLKAYDTAIQRDTNYMISTQLTQSQASSELYSKLGIGGAPRYIGNKSQIEPSFFTKAKDIFGSQISVGGFTLNTLFGNTGTLIEKTPRAEEQYLNQTGKLFKKEITNLNTYGPILGGQLNALESYNFQMEQRKSSLILEQKKMNQESAMKQFAFNTNILNSKNITGTPEYTSEFNTNLNYLKSSGVGIAADTVTTSKETRGGYSYLDTATGMGWEVSPEITTQSKTDYTFKTLDLESPTIGVQNYLSSKGKNVASVGYGIGADISTGINYAVVGVAAVTVGAELGLGAAIETGVVGLGTTLISRGVTSPTTLNTISNVGSKVLTGGFIGLTGYESVKSGISGYQQSGDNIGTTITSGLKPIFQAGGFVIGASKGALSPFGTESLIDTGTQETKATLVGIRNPFGKSGKTLFSFGGEGGASLGLPSVAKVGSGSIEVGGQLSRQFVKSNLNVEQLSAYADVEKALSKYGGAKFTSPTQQTVGLSETTWFNRFGSDVQKEFTNILGEGGKTTASWGGIGKRDWFGIKTAGRAFKNVGIAMKERAFQGAFSSPDFIGTERIFGSTTNPALSRLRGDIDLVAIGRIIPKTETAASRLNIAFTKDISKGFDIESLSDLGIKGSSPFIALEGKVSAGSVKMIEGFGLDVASIEKSPFAFSGRLPGSGKLSTGESLPTQKVGETLTQRAASYFSINIKPGTGGQFTVGPRVGQEKAGPDIYKTLEYVGKNTPKFKNELEGIKQSFGKFIVKSNPAIDLESGTIGGGFKTPKSFSLAPSSISSIGSFKSSSVSSSSSSSFDMSKFSMPSISSKSSISSLSSSFPSSISSKSSLSSLSSKSSSVSSASSFSSSSSSSSSSSYSTGSGSSLSGSSFFPGLDIPSLGGFALPTGKSRGRKSNVWNIAPSFTGIIGNIQMTSPLKVSKTYGVTPFQTRGLFVGKKSKSQPYYQLTDL